MAPLLRNPLRRAFRDGARRGWGTSAMKAAPRAYASARRRPPRAEVVHLPGGEHEIAIVADTHGRPHENARALIEALRPPLILHAGDIGDLAVLDALREIAPVLAVRGNIDTQTASLPDSLAIELTSDERAPLKLWLTHIAVYGPKLHADVARSAKEHGAGIVVCGHSHVPFVGRDKGLIVFNPGSIGPRRFSLPICFGVLHLGAAGASLRHVDCETGATWLP